MCNYIVHDANFLVELTEQYDNEPSALLYEIFISLSSVVKEVHHFAEKIPIGQQLAQTKNMS